MFAVWDFFLFALVVGILLRTSKALALRLLTLFVVWVFFFFFQCKVFFTNKSGTSARYSWSKTTQQSLALEAFRTELPMLKTEGLKLISFPEINKLTACRFCC